MITAADRGRKFAFTPSATAPGGTKPYGSTHSSPRRRELDSPSRFSFCGARPWTEFWRRSSRGDGRSFEASNKHCGRRC